MFSPFHAGVAGPADGGRRVETGGLANAYSIGFVFSGNWQLSTSASFIVDNFRFLPRNPIDHADFNDDNLCVGAAFWSRLAETYLRDA